MKSSGQTSKPPYKLPQNSKIKSSAQTSTPPLTLQTCISNDDDSDNSVNHNSDNNDSVNDDGAFDEDNSKNNLMNVEFDRKRSCTENGDPSKRRRMQDSG